MKPAHLLPFIVFLFAGGCVSERCYENFHCTSPKVCGPDGKCMFECSLPSDCLAGFTCEGHRCVRENGDSGPDALSPVIYCPSGMVLVQDLFCIDIYEATRLDSTSTSPGTDESRAVTRKGAYPWLTKDNAVAEAACGASDKRLCEPAEWKLACSGPDGQVYSYGDEYEPATCNGIDTYGRTGFHLMPTGSFAECTNEFGVFDMNGNVWEHVAGGDGTDVRGGAYNCSDSRSYQRCSYVPTTWNPSAQGFRCCRDPLRGTTDTPESVEVVSDVIEPVDASSVELVDAATVDLPLYELPVEEICVQPDSTPGDPGAVDSGLPDIVVSDLDSDVAETDAAQIDTVSPDTAPVDVPVSDTAVDHGQDDSGYSDLPAEVVEYRCPADMSLVSLPGRQAFCMDRWEASRSDSTANSYGISTVPVSQSGRLPWWSSSMTAVSAADACLFAGKRLCLLDEWYGACVGTADTTYVYGDEYNPAVCNSIDTFCYCDTTCSGVAECPYPHCRVSASPAGDGGPCGANFHVTVTGLFPSCVNEWGVFDVNGNVWEVVDAGDSLNHFRGGAFNCSDSEALHRCDHDGTWNPSAKGFRCCMNAQVLTGATE